LAACLSISIPPQDDVGLLAYYQAALSEDCLRLKLCEVRTQAVAPVRAALGLKGFTDNPWVGIVWEYVWIL
jgi:hypothetical protein